MQANLSRMSLPLGLATASAIALAPIATAGQPPMFTRDDLVAAARAKGPSALVELLARYDVMPVSRERDELAVFIDAVAGQRYATVSRLYWYTDLAAAETAAKLQHRPILALRMLGRLDHDLSCANSRLFRATLYANAEVSQYLRDHFVLYWSTERPVPQVTIDFGDGRKLVRTTTGNSAHYVLDEDGHVLDVLPGIYAPIAFRTELAKSLALATKVRGASDAQRASAVYAYHQDRLAETQAAWQKVMATPYIGGMHRLLTAGDVDSALAKAQRATMSKAYVEVPDLRYIAPDANPGSAPDADVTAKWASIGQMLYGIGDLRPVADTERARFGVPRRVAQKTATAAKPPRVLDERSRTLVAHLHDAVPAELAATPAQRDEMLARLEQHLVADTALDQMELRPAISQHIVEAGGKVELASLNAWIYETVFHTPASDPWLGLVPRSDFTGLPGDGIVMR
jgi:hypothetical protein